MKKTAFCVILLFTSLFCIVSCKKKSDPAPETPVTPNTPTTQDINSKYQASFSIDGTPVSYISKYNALDMSYGNDHTLNGVGYGPSTFKYDGTLHFGSSAKFISIKKGTITLPGGGAPESDAEFLALFSIGTANYTVDADSGVVIGYWDGTTQWNSDFGVADQTGSVFTIVDRKVLTGTSDYTVKVYITFNCKLYDGAGNVKTITNGKYIADFQKFI